MIAFRHIHKRFKHASILTKLSANTAASQRCYGDYSEEVDAASSSSGVHVNGIKYSFPRAGQPVVGICLDGSQQEYIDVAIEEGLMPNYQAIVERRAGFGEAKDLASAPTQGIAGLAAAVMPTFTNPNNMGIMTGGTPDVHGISGNYFWDNDRQEEVSMVDPSYLRADSIFGKFSQAGVGVTVVTAKDKLRNLLSHQLESPSYGCGSIAFSVEKGGDDERVQEFLKERGYGENLEDFMGKPPPGIYDPMCSIYCLDIGAELVERRQQSQEADMPWLYYLSTTDYVQHKHDPYDPIAQHFYSEIDRVVGRLDKCGAVVGITADHGMNGKVGFNGEPKVVFASSIFKEAGIEARVLLPITDPYTVHHGSLGGYATVYIQDKARLQEAMQIMRDTAGIYTVLNNEEACKAFKLPSDRVGDIVLVGDDSTVIGKSPEEHELGDVPNLRTHGSLSEMHVPFMVSKQLKPVYAKQLAGGKTRNFHLYDFLLNGLA